MADYRKSLDSSIELLQSKTDFQLMQIEEMIFEIAMIRSYREEIEKLISVRSFIISNVDKPFYLLL